MVRISIVEDDYVGGYHRKSVPRPSVITNVQTSDIDYAIEVLSLLKKKITSETNGKVKE